MDSQVYSLVEELASYLEGKLTEYDTVSCYSRVCLINSH